VKVRRKVNGRRKKGDYKEKTVNGGRTSGLTGLCTLLTLFCVYLCLKGMCGVSRGYCGAFEMDVV